MSGAAAEPTKAKLRVPPPRGPVEPLPAAPSFSVVVPAFEAAGTIGETIGSVLAQSPGALEVVVVDDGSADSLDRALEPFGSRIELIRQPQNRGVAAARNAGLHRCSGDFVLVVDADDVLLPGRLAALGLLGRERPDLDVLCTDVYFEADGTRRGRFFEQNPFPLDGQRQAILERCFPIHPAARRSRLLEIGGFDESLRTGEDWDCAIRLTLGGSLTGLYDEPLELYRIRGGSLTSSRTGAFRDRARVLEKALANPDLRPQERPVATRMRAAQRGRAVLTDAQAAVAADRPDARRRCWELVTARECSPRDRLWGLASLASPRPLRRWLSRRGGGTSQLSRHLPETEAKR
ncbi:MAG TPA: glycosyltransferase [Solirubrobacterales bacterium]|nr:glycosyltransferase [Solirubrobacterales bacterium]